MVTAGAMAGPRGAGLQSLYRRKITRQSRTGSDAFDQAESFAAAAQGKIKAQVWKVLPLSSATPTR